MSFPIINQQFSDQANVWFYFLPKELGQDEIVYFEAEKNEFLQKWNSHGQAIFAEMVLVQNRLIIVVAENISGSISGCSIDKSLALMKSLSLKWQMDLLDRNWVIYEKSPGNLEFSRLNLFWALRKAHEINDDTIVYDTTIQNVGQLRNAFKKTFSQSWHAQMW